MDSAYFAELNLSACRVSCFGFVGIGHLFQIEGWIEVFVKLSKTQAMPLGGGRKQRLPENHPVTILRVTAYNGGTVVQKEHN